MASSYENIGTKLLRVITQSTAIKEYYLSAERLWIFARISGGSDERNSLDQPADGDWRCRRRGACSRNVIESLSAGCDTRSTHRADARSLAGVQGCASCRQPGRLAPGGFESQPSHHRLHER